MTDPIVKVLLLVCSENSVSTYFFIYPLYLFYSVQLDIYIHQRIFNTIVVVSNKKGKEVRYRPFRF